MDPLIRFVLVLPSQHAVKQVFVPHRPNPFVPTPELCNQTSVVADWRATVFIGLINGVAEQNALDFFCGINVLYLYVLYIVTWRGFSLARFLAGGIPRLMWGFCLWIKRKPEETFAEGDSWIYRAL